MMTDHKRPVHNDSATGFVEEKPTECDADDEKPAKYVKKGITDAENSKQGDDSVEQKTQTTNETTSLSSEEPSDDEDSSSLLSACESKDDVVDSVDSQACSIKVSETVSESGNLRTANDPQNDTLPATPSITKNIIFGSAVKNMVSFTSLATKEPNSSFSGLLEGPGIIKPTKSILNPDASPFFVPEAPQKTTKDIATGEEDEQTVFQARVKLFVFLSSDGDSCWKERGIGNIKINESNKNSSERRILMRAEGTLKLLINARIFEGMSFEHADSKSVRIVLFNAAGGEDEKQTPKEMVALIRFKGNEETLAFVRHLGCHTSIY